MREILHTPLPFPFLGENLVMRPNLVARLAGKYVFQLGSYVSKMKKRRDLEETTFFLRFFCLFLISFS